MRDDEIAAMRGDRAAFGRLVRVYQRRVFFVALRICGDAETAADLTQQTFVQAWTHRDGFRDEAAISTWLLRIVTHLAINERRRAWRHRETATPDGWDPADRSDDPEGLARAAQARRAVAAALDTLPDRQRAVATLRLHEELEFAEIGTALGITATNAKAAFHLACKKLRDRLALDRAPS